MSNYFLEDSNYIRKLDFPDIYYLESLCYKISSFLKNVPVPVNVEYKDRKFIFAVGSATKIFDIDVDISYYDMITLIKNWLKNYFPQYVIIKEEEISLSEDEIIERLNKDKKSDINDLINETKIVKREESGIIEKVFIKTDQFLFNKNGYREIRMSGLIDSPLPLSMFMKNLRTYKNEKDDIKNIHIYEYIMNNSHPIKQIGNDLKDVSISYSGKQMYNFFVINFPNLKDYDLKKIDDFNYLWSNFKIKFDSPTLKSDCIDYYNKMKEKDV